MQALTPLLFSMLFPRFSNKNAVNRDFILVGDNPSESLLSDNRVSNELPCFQEGYLLQDRARHSHEHHQQQQHLPAKTRKHRSTGSTNTSPRRSATMPLEVNNSGITRNNTFPQTDRKAGPPKSLSLDHAAFMATFPMLDGLGDTSRPRDYSCYPGNTASKANSVTSTSPKPKALRKKQSQELTASRSSTSSLCSMVSDTSSSSSSSSILREPLTPTKSTNNYRSVEAVANNKKNSITKDLINLHGFGDEEGRLCLSPQSSNFFDLEGHHESQVLAGQEAGYTKAVVAGARGQRQLIAH
ncbi:hypothetical protein BGZ65_011354 [Modicella reniformis]|uniref:Uncharacterized protein n=1 Tax=Modicella reniformis TaxID=1440133 RepID=A0A9P6INN7_9FUNG|nr:hypothetical protein BGZ65_011354 [Modicella reniformis]